jgi:hypothetical protein
MMALMLSLSTMLLGCGCASLLPSSEAITRSRWKTYDEVKAAFDRILLLETRTTDLRALGFDPTSPNVKLLTYLDVIQRFMPNESITKEDLDKAVRECIEAREGSYALELELDEVKGKRVGNIFLDIFGFRRKTHHTGWRFRALLLIRDDRVLYKLASGEPAVDRYDKRVKPLGPLQELDSILLRGLSSLY